ncbi:MAG: glycoside hydrolase family 78 protein [Candidatus Pacebacteria bacterium]|nr:glycoside hydrolase family 78 protein [Candidatus Paceibacterota bacterium]
MTSIVRLIQFQGAFQLRIASHPDRLRHDSGDVWDSGRVCSDEQECPVPADVNMVSGGRYYWQVRVWDAHGHAGEWSEINHWTMGLLDETDWDADWISPAREPCPTFDDKGSLHRHPTWWMRRNVVIDDLPEQVSLAVVCLGYYELYINGRRVGEEPLAPSLTKLDTRALSIVHEVRPFLRRGVNCIALWCSSGWYLSHQFRVHEGMTPLLRLQGYTRSPGEDLRVLFASDESWLCREANRLIVGLWQWNNFGGEEVDARSYVRAWNRQDCSDRGWHKARAVSAPPITVSARTCPPNRIGETFPARKIRALGDGRYEIDFGTCLAGWVRIRFRDLAAGQTVTMRFFDLPADNERVEDHSYNQVSFYHASGDGEDMFENKFNYAGFRYMTVEGLDSLPRLADAEAFLIESAMSPAGSFRCSNELFNRIHDLNVHTLRCLDLGGYSVDCPHRERFGYGADGQAALPAYLYTMDAASFMRKWLIDWCDVYEPDSGRLSHCAPTVHAEESPIWGGVVVVLAWHLWLFFRDRGSLESAFPVMRGYLKRVRGAVREGIVKADAYGWCFHGDWVAFGRGMDSGRAPDIAMRELVNTAYMIHVWQLFIRIARVLGRDEEIPEAEATVERLRRGLHRTFFEEEHGYYLLPEQACQVLPLAVGAVPEELRQRVHDKLIELITVDSRGHLDTGMTATGFLIDYLSGHGRDDVVDRIFNQETAPSWGYMLGSGATTIWEQWNGHWSQIHSTMAGPAVWFYTGLGGIRPDEASPGFESFDLAPSFLPSLEFVEASFESPRGTIRSSWRRSGGTLKWSVAIPPNSRATLTIPVAGCDAVLLDGESLSLSSEAEVSQADGSALHVRLAGGTYRVEWPDTG